MNEVVPVKMDGAQAVPAPEADTPSTQVDTPSIMTQPVTRRGVMAGGVKLAVGAAAVSAGIVAKEKFDPIEHELALLKMDEHHKLALIHRTLSLSSDEAITETAKTSVTGVSERTTDISGKTSIILSPDLKLRPKGNFDDPQNIDGPPIHIKNCPKNLYLPYHLLDHAASLGVRREGSKIILSIATLPEAKDSDKTMVSVENAKRYAAYQAEMAKYEAWLLAHKAGNASADVADDLLDSIGNPFGWGKDEPTHSAPPTPPAQPDYLKPGEVTGHFTITFDAPEKVEGLPDIHFYNGFTGSTPSFTLKREELAKGLLSNNRTYTLLHSTPTGKVDENDNPIHHRHFEPKEFAHEVEAASTCRECSVKDGIVYKVWDAAKETFIEDNSIGKSELSALQMALHFQQGKIEARGEGSWIEDPSRAIDWVEKHATLTGIIKDQTPGR